MQRLWRGRVVGQENDMTLDGTNIRTLKTKDRCEPNGILEALIPLDENKGGPIFQKEGSGNSQFGGNETQIDPAFEQHDAKPHNRSTTSPLVINRCYTVDLAKKAKSFAYESKNTSNNKEECNQFADEGLIS